MTAWRIWSGTIAGGTDRSKFTLTAGGELAFKVAKDYENPDDANRDGDYEITVRVSDGESGGGGLHRPATGCG